MKALRFHNRLHRLAATALLGRITPRAYVSRFAPLRLEDLPIPELPGPDWLRVRTVQAGVCGSDLKETLLRGDLDNPLTALISFPHVLGHEAVGVVEKAGPQARHAVGERIVLNPWLTCAPRGIHPPCAACQSGDFPLCRNIDAGVLPRGIHLGNNAAVPGAFSEQFVCHDSQAFPIPAGVTDDQAVLSDPFSVSLHSVLQNPPPLDAPALVYGLGVLGLMAVAALRRLYPSLEIWGVGRYPHQLEHASRLGANWVTRTQSSALIEQVAGRLGASLKRPWRGPPWLLDGVGVVYDTVGSPQSIETAIRIARPRARLVVSGVEAPRRFEWTPIYFKEIQVVGSNAFGVEPYQGQRRHAFDIYLELAASGMDLSGLITHRFSLSAWPQAFLALMEKGKTRSVKVILDRFSDL